MRAVAAAYRRERRAGRLDGPAREAAIAAFRARHPELERLAASEAAARIIAWAAQEHTAWFWGRSRIAPLPSAGGWLLLVEAGRRQ